MGPVAGAKGTLLSQLLMQGPIKAGDMRHEPWYTSLYLKLNDKTRQRDLIRLCDLDLIYLEKEERVWAGCFSEGQS